MVLVEDHGETRRLLAELLQDEGILVIGQAASGEEGVELTRRLVPEVVLMDLNMPGMGGVEATRRIKEALPDTQVIVLTMYEGPHPTRSAEDVGAYAYLIKGCSVGFVRDIVISAWKFCMGLRAERASASA